MTQSAPGDAGRHVAETAELVPGRRKKRVVLVAAVAQNAVIGRDGDIPWHISEDLKHFRATTRDNTVLMGRRTYESIGHPLPYRTNVVVTRNPDWSAEGVFVVHTVEEGIDRAQDFEGDVMVIGGGHVYAAAMPLADIQVLTEVHEAPEGDTYYPDFDRHEWREAKREPHDGYDFVWWERVEAG
jgi:dihydrofolate reductase